MVVSVTALVLAALVIAIGVLVGVFALAFLDSCYPPQCRESAVWTAVIAPLAVATAVGLAGMATTIIRLTRRRPAWPFALGALAVAVIVLAAGAVGYTAAVG